MTGFLGKTKEGEITTMGRGGSDYTAAIIGNAIDADEVQIWTDVDGIMSTDPKIVGNARTLEKTSKHTTMTQAPIASLGGQS